MTFNLTIDTDNAAFLDDPDELVTLLRKVITKLEAGYVSGGIMDSNGNRVGGFDFDTDPADNE